MNKPTVYLETSVVSYLTAWPSRDLVVAAHQQVTRDWWQGRDRFELFISEAVIAEASRGDSIAAEERLAAIAEVPILSTTDEAHKLARSFLEAAAMPPKAALDAVHVAIACVHGVTFLASWNCKHIANVFVRQRVETVCHELGFEPPIICTPLELVSEEEL